MKVQPAGVSTDFKPNLQSKCAGLALSEVFKAYLALLFMILGMATDIS